MEKFILGALGFLIGGIIVLCVDGLFASRSDTYYGIVIERSYRPSQTSVGTGTGVTSNGDVGVVTTVSTSSEEWKVIVKVDGMVVSATASPELWADAEKGDEVALYRMEGLFSGSTWGWYLCTNDE